MLTQSYCIFVFNYKKISLVLFCFCVVMSDSREKKRKRTDWDDRVSEEPLAKKSKHKHKEKKKEKRDKKHEHHDQTDKKKKEKKHKDKEKRKGKKDRKHKKHSKEKTASKKWAPYGELTSADYFTKQQEFDAWLLDIKKLQPDVLPLKQRKELFADFQEDYNLGELPSKKYYFYDAWEKKQLLKRLKRQKEELANSYDESTIGTFNDEEELYRKKAAAREQLRLDDYNRKVQQVKSLLHTHGRTILEYEVVPTD